MMKRRLIFVDDQPNVLSGLKRMLHRMTDEWEMEFVDSGTEALKAMEHQPHDLIVSDMMMPEMNGAQLLKIVSERYSGTVRFILSGYSDRELILQSVGFAHRYLAKPCDPATLKSALASSLQLRNLLCSRELHSRIAQIVSLPTLPSVYNELVTELQSETASIRRIGDLIAKDVSMTAKVLHVVNSAFFSLPARVCSPFQAVNLLGLDNVFGLVTVAGAFSQFDCAQIANLSIESIYNHSISVGSSAKSIAKFLHLSPQEADYASIAGMLHDIGKLVMITHFREEMISALRLVSEKSMLLHEAESQIRCASTISLGAPRSSAGGSCVSPPAAACSRADRWSPDCRPHSQ
jgi:response regulator RpfG family c-di-GMP phosphodiesterase